MTIYNRHDLGVFACVLAIRRADEGDGWRKHFRSRGPHPHETLDGGGVHAPPSSRWPASPRWWLLFSQVLRLPRRGGGGPRAASPSRRPRLGGSGLLLLRIKIKVMMFDEPRGPVRAHGRGAARRPRPVGSVHHPVLLRVDADPLAATTGRAEAVFESADERRGDRAPRRGGLHQRRGDGAPALCRAHPSGWSPSARPRAGRRGRLGDPSPATSTPPSRSPVVMPADASPSCRRGRVACATPSPPPQGLAPALKWPNDALIAAARSPGSSSERGGRLHGRPEGLIAIGVKRRPRAGRRRRGAPPRPPAPTPRPGALFEASPSARTVLARLGAPGAPALAARLREAAIASAHL